MPCACACLQGAAGWVENGMLTDLFHEDLRGPPWFVSKYLLVSTPHPTMGLAVVAQLR